MSPVSRNRTVLLTAAPLVLLAVLLALIWRLDPVSSLRGNAPPVEEISFERVTLSPQAIEIRFLNDGPDPVTVAQVQVDEAYWAFDIEPADGVLRHLERGVVHLAYPWVEGETHELRLVTSTGLTFDHTIAVAVTSPRPSGRTLGIYGLIGLYVGVLPVALGLLWYPMVRGLGDNGLGFVLALTVGLLLFLFVDALHEGMEVARQVASSYQGTALLVFAALAAYVAIEGAGRWFGGEASGGFGTALLVAIGIGLHNLGEGLAIGAAFGIGEAGLGSLLIVGFMLHNTTEGLAIVAPLSRERVGFGRLVWLGLIAGVPTIAGAWIGGFAYSALWSVVFLGVGAGAIAQVVVQVTKTLARKRSLLGLLRSGPVAGGLFAGVAVMYVTGLLVG